MDCTDINVLLSGLIDDEIDANTRHAAERHLVECKVCRDLLSETESLNTLVAQEAGALVDPAGLPPDFEAKVLSRTVYADPPATVAGWTNWLGWLAAAAALALAVSIWVMDQKPTPIQNASARPDDSFEFVPVLRSPAPHLRSSVYTDEDPDSNPATGSIGFSGTQADGGEISTPEALVDAETDDVFELTPMIATETLDTTVWLFDMLLVEDEKSYGDVDYFRSIANYDRLLTILAAIRPRLDAADRTAVYSAESIVRDLVEGPRDLGQMRTDLRQLRLSETLTDIADRWQPEPAL